jgi:hypothetical protein
MEEAYNTIIDLLMKEAEKEIKAVKEEYYYSRKIQDIHFIKMRAYLDFLELARNLVNKPDDKERNNSAG